MSEKDTELKLKEVSGQRDKSPIVTTKKSETFEHELKIALNKLVREAGAAGIPIFTAYYSQDEGYVFNGMLPEEIGTDSVKSEYGRFDQFMRICLDFNKEDAFKAERITLSD